MKGNDWFAQVEMGHNDTDASFDLDFMLASDMVKYSGDPL